MQPRVSLLTISSHGNCLLMGTLILLSSLSRKFKTFLQDSFFGHPRHHNSMEKLQWLNSHFRTYWSCVSMFQCYKWFWSRLPLWTATCLHSVSYITLFFWHQHAENPAIQMQDSWLLPFLLLWTPPLEFTPTRSLTLLNPVIFYSQAENLPLLTVFLPQLVSTPSFCYSHCVFVCACLFICVCVCVSI